MAWVCKPSCIKVRFGRWKLFQRNFQSVQQEWWRSGSSICKFQKKSSIVLIGCIPAEEMKFVLSTICSEKVEIK